MRKIAVLFFTVNLTAHALNAQNLVQNPGFEASTQWDSLWTLSLSDPSSATAVASVFTADFHEGMRSAELSNTQFNRWTYLYTDSIQAPLNFLAHKSYEVSGWFKSLELGKETNFSVFWDGSRQQRVVYSGNPDPAFEPGWFWVKDTITPEADFSDGYLAVGFRAGKNGLLATGRLLIDDFTVVRIPDISEAAILAFTIPGQNGPTVIDGSTGNIEVEVPESTDLTILAPDQITLSRGASVVPAAGDVVDFSLPVVYTVTAQDGVTVREWTVTVDYPPSSETDILSFFLERQTGPPLIDTAVHTVVCEVEYGTELTALTPQFQVSEGAALDPPTGTAVDFSAPVIYRVTAEDGVTFQDWTVTVQTAAPLTGTDIISFTLAEQTGTAVIDTANHTIAIEVEKTTDLTVLSPEIQVSDGASIDPASGTVVDFSEAVIFTVTAEDGVTTQSWTVTVTLDPAVSIPEYEEKERFVVYPNPSGGILHVAMGGHGDIIVRDVLGRTVQVFEEARAGERVTLSLNGKGLFLIQVKSGSESKVFKVLIR